MAAPQRRATRIGPLVLTALVGAFHGADKPDTASKINKRVAA